MQTRQAKAHSSNTAQVNATETPQEAAVSAAAVTRMPVWTQAWGNHPPAALISPVAELQAKHIISQPGDSAELHRKRSK